MLQASKCMKQLNHCGQKQQKLPEHKEKTKVEFKCTKKCRLFCLGGCPRQRSRMEWKEMKEYTTLHAIIF